MTDGEARGEGLEPSSPDSKSGSLPLADPRKGFVESAMRESNPPVQLGRLAPLPIGQWHLCHRSGRRGSRTLKAVTLTPLQTGRHHPLACPSVFKSSGGRNRTCTHPLNRRPPYHLATPEYSLCQQSGRSDLNRRSRGSGPRGMPNFPTS